MLVESLQPGDTVFAAQSIVNDGSMPGFEESQTIANKGQRGVIINTGHLEHQPDKILILVRFEVGEKSGDLGPAVACWPNELTVESH